MSKFNYQKNLLLFLNVSGIYSFKLSRDGNLKISKVYSFLNFLKIFFVPSIIVFMIKNNDVRRQVFGDETLNISKFSNKFMELSMMCIITTIFLITTLQFLRREQNLKLLKNLRKFEFSEKSKKILFRKCVINFSVILLALSASSASVFLKFINSTSPFSLIVFIASIFPSYINFMFIFLIKSCQECFVLKLNDICEDLEEFFDDFQVKYCPDYESFYRKNMEVKFLSLALENFHDALGLQLTIFVISIITIITTHVRLKTWFLFNILFFSSFFQYFSLIHFLLLKTDYEYVMFNVVNLVPAAIIFREFLIVGGEELRKEKEKLLHILSASSSQRLDKETRKIVGFTIKF